jgi:hypothetical protein
MSRQGWAVSLSLLVLLAVGGVAWAQTSNGHDLSWHVLSAGGSEGMTSGTHTVHSTVSQLAIGPAAGAQHDVESGYWHGVLSLMEEGYGIYLPLVMKGHAP